MPGSTLASTRRLALAGMFAGLAWGAGYVDSIPNFEFLTVILFAAGWVLGPLGGALAGALGEFLYSAINPYGSGLMHPLVLASQVFGMALAGVVGGLLGRSGIARPALRWLAVVASGVLVTLVFDLVTNLASGAVYGQWKATMIAALPFALIHVGTNAALFATVGVLLVRALERTRRSLRAGPLAAALLCIAIPVRAQTPVPATQVPLAAPPPADSLARPSRSPLAASPASPDSIAYRDQSRAFPLALWGEGPAAFLRRDDWSLGAALTREGGFVERFADDRGSAEPLGRFGLAGANRVLVSWLGMPLTGVGAIGGETLRVPWSAVAVFEAPRLPLSATEAYRGELGGVRLLEPDAVNLRRHPRVQGWAQTGRPGVSHNGFAASGSVRRFDGFLAVDAATLAPLEPLGPEGDHSIQGRLAWSDARWEFSGAYRSSHLALESLDGRHERRRGEGGVMRAARLLGNGGGARASLAFEKTADSFVDDENLLGRTAQRGRGGRATLRLETVPSLEVPPWPRTAFAAVTYGRESLESERNVAVDRRRASLWWASAGGTFGHHAFLARGAVGAGKYGNGAIDVAPSLLFEFGGRETTSFWAGVARGLTAAPRAASLSGDSLTGAPPIARTSTWLAGIGVMRRSRWWVEGGSWRGAAPRGAMAARAALYAGESSPGRDPARFLFAGETAENAENTAFLEDGTATRFLALTATGGWSPLAGVSIFTGGHALGRRVDGGLDPSDPEARGHLTLEARHRFGSKGPDARVAATGEWIGPRDGTPAGDLPAATRLGLAAAIVIDEFELRAHWGNAAGSNRFLPLVDPDTLEPRRAEDSLLRIEARWTFWD